MLETQWINLSTMIFLTNVFSVADLFTLFKCMCASSPYITGVLAILEVKCLAVD